MKPHGWSGRRGFIGILLITLGAIGGWLTRAWSRRGPGTGESRSAADHKNPFAYDISQYETTDPALLRYRESSSFETGLNRVKRLRAAPGGRLWVAGERSMKQFAVSGEALSEIRFPKPPHCVDITPEGRLLVAMGQHFEIHEPGRSETRLLQSPRLPGAAFVTAIAATPDAIYVADAGNREVLICRPADGRVVDRFGKKGEAEAAKGNPGFAIPSPYFDLKVAADGRLKIANPGELRVETYSPAGQFQSSWGRPGMQVDRFCGCCNPVYFDLTPEGDVITSEKGLARIHLYSAEGIFRGVVAGPDMLVKDKELAKRACADCQVGAGFDVSLAETGEIYVLDPFSRRVRIFSPLPGTLA